jgi:hypothetical protein
MDDKFSEALHEQCVSRLREYVAQAETTCAMLRQFKDKPPSGDELKSIMVQRSSENEAHRKYMEVREHLFEVTQRDYRR